MPEDSGAVSSRRYSAGVDNRWPRVIGTDTGQTRDKQRDSDADRVPSARDGLHAGSVGTVQIGRQDLVSKEQVPGSAPFGVRHATAQSREQPASTTWFRAAGHKLPGYFAPVFQTETIAEEGCGEQHEEFRNVFKGRLLASNTATD